MSARRPNPRLAKINRSYTVEEAARLYEVHRNTIRAWIAGGLATSAGKRPFLILGIDLRQYLETKRRAAKKPCKPGEVYCVRCRVPRRPAGGFADLIVRSATTGDLEAICPVCETLIFRRVSLSRLALVGGDLEIRLPESLRLLTQSAKPSVISDFNRGG